MSSGRKVGKNMARNYKTFPGKIQSYAKRHDIDIPEQDEIRDGYKRLRRAQIQDLGGGRDTVILGDKEDYIKLTDHGLTLVTLIDSRESLRRKVKEQVGVEFDEEEPWWPYEFDEGDATIQMEAISERPPEGTEEYEIEAKAEFTCPRCGSEIVHTYTFQEPSETWSRTVSADCPECEMEWCHIAGNPHQKPEPR
jgi:DNA-directed RNA polymerase subunit M/transcription elongation factor TFIIS